MLSAPSVPVPPVPAAEYVPAILGTAHLFTEDGEVVRAEVVTDGYALSYEVDFFNNGLGRRRPRTRQTTLELIVFDAAAFATLDRWGRRRQAVRVVVSGSENLVWSEPAAAEVLPATVDGFRARRVTLQTALRTPRVAETDDLASVLLWALPGGELDLTGPPDPDAAWGTTGATAASVGADGLARFTVPAAGTAALLGRLTAPMTGERLFALVRVSATGGADVTLTARVRAFPGAAGGGAVLQAVSFPLFAPGDYVVPLPIPTGGWEVELAVSALGGGAPATVVLARPSILTRYSYRPLFGAAVEMASQTPATGYFALVEEGDGFVRLQPIGEASVEQVFYDVQIEDPATGQLITSGRGYARLGNAEVVERSLKALPDGGATLRVFPAS